MEKEKHTPKKWEGHIGMDYAVVMLPGECTENASIRVSRGRSEIVPLIVAAPELLEALRGLFEHCVMIHSTWGDGNNAKKAEAAIMFAQASIAKAEGRA